MGEHEGPAEESARSEHRYDNLAGAETVRAAARKLKKASLLFPASFLALGSPTNAMVCLPQGAGNSAILTVDLCWAVQVRGRYLTVRMDDKLNRWR
jgi:hypothetical protein